MPTQRELDREGMLRECRVPSVGLWVGELRIEKKLSHILSRYDR